MTPLYLVGIIETKRGKGSNAAAKIALVDQHRIGGRVRKNRDRLAEGNEFRTAGTGF